MLGDFRTEQTNGAEEVTQKEWAGHTSFGIFSQFLSDCATLSLLCLAQLPRFCSKTVEVPSLRSRLRHGCLPHGTGGGRSV